MANNIYHKINSHKKQTTVIKDDKLVIPGQTKIEDKVSEINKKLGVNFSGTDGGDQYVKDITAERDRRQPNMPLKEYMELKDRQNAQAGNTDFQGTENGENVDATNWSDQDVDYGNRTEQVVTPGQDATPDRNVVLDNEYQVNQSRVESGEQKRREGMIDRSTKRRDKRAFRLLNKNIGNIFAIKALGFTKKNMKKIKINNGQFTMDRMVIILVVILVEIKKKIEIFLYILV